MATRKAPAHTKTPARKPTPFRPAGSRHAANASGLSAPPVGEVYGEESWKEEELSAAELDADAPELDELESEDGPEIGDESDNSEW